MLFADGPENVRLKPSDTNYVKRENDRLQDVTCKADCKPTCSFKWTKIGQQSRETVISHNAVLNLGKLESSEEGTYRCTVTRVNTTPRTIDLTVNVIYGPRNILFSPSTDVYLHNEHYDLPPITCSADCWECNYSWSGPNSFNSANAVLDLSPLTKTMTGIYSCTARNTRLQPRNEQMKNLQINVRYGPNFANVNVTSPYNFIEGDNLILECKSECYPGCTYKWINKTSGSAVSGSTDILHIDGVKRYMTGEYECVSKNADASYLKSTNTTVSVNIKERTIVKSFFIGNNESQSIITVHEQDDDIRFTCDISGDPAEYVKVKFNGQTLKEETDTDSLIYILYTANCFDTGVYECEVKSKQMEITRKHVSLFVTCSPRPQRKIKENITISLGVPVAFTFEALAYPEPGPKGFTWYKGRGTQWLRILSNEDFQIYSSKLKTNLTIVSVSKADYGQYRVTTVNIFGTYHQYFFLLRQEITYPGGIKEENEHDNSLILTIGIVLGAICIISTTYAVTVTIIWKRNVSNKTIQRIKMANTDRSNESKMQTTYANVVYTTNDENVQEHLPNNTDRKTTGEDNAYQSSYTELDKIARESDDNIYDAIRKDTHFF